MMASFTDDDFKSFENITLKQERANSQKYECLNRLEQMTDNKLCASLKEQDLQVNNACDCCSSYDMEE